MLAVFSTNVQADEKILATPEFEKENTSSEDKNWNFELGGGVMYVSYNRHNHLNCICSIAL
jgi:hypothetical protein